MKRQAIRFFHILPNFRDQRGGFHDAIEGWLVNEATRAKFCGPMLMDTGAPGLTIITSEGGVPWPSEAHAAITFSERGEVKLGAQFIVGLRAQASRSTIEQRPNAPGTRLAVGLMPYFGYSVLYDPAQGGIGLKPRPGGIAGSP